MKKVYLDAGERFQASMAEFAVDAEGGACYGDGELVPDAMLRYWHPEDECWYPVDYDNQGFYYLKEVA